MNLGVGEGVRAIAFGVGGGLTLTSSVFGLFYSVEYLVEQFGTGVPIVIGLIIGLTLLSIGTEV